MPGKLHPDKEKIGYTEWSDVRAEINRARDELGKKLGREVTETEMFRRITLAFANKCRKAKGKKILELEPEASNTGGLRRNEPPPLRWDRAAQKYLPAGKKKVA